MVMIDTNREVLVQWRFHVGTLASVIFGRLTRCWASNIAQTKLLLRKRLADYDSKTPSLIWEKPRPKNGN